MNAKAKYEAYRRAGPAWWPRRHPGNPARPTNPPVTNRDGCHGCPPRRPADRRRGVRDPQFLPQLRKLRATDDTAGVSWPWATLTSVNNAAWLAYFAASAYWAALVPASSATLLAGALAVMLARRGRATARAGGADQRLGRAPGRSLRRRRPQRPGDAAHGRLRRASHPVGLDRLPNRSPHRDLAGNLAPHPRRAVLLDHLRGPQVRPAPDHPRPHRRCGEPAHARRIRRTTEIQPSTAPQRAV